MPIFQLVSPFGYNIELWGTDLFDRSFNRNAPQASEKPLAAIDRE